MKQPQTSDRPASPGRGENPPSLAVALALTAVALLVLVNRAPAHAAPTPAKAPPSAVTR